MSSPPRKLRFKKSKSCAKFVAKVAQKILESCAKVARNFAYFGCKILLWSFGTSANFGNEQQKRSSILYRLNEVQKLDIFGKPRNCNFRTDSYRFRKANIMGAERFQFAPTFPQNERLSATKQPQISQSCAIVVLRNIAIFW